MASRDGCAASVEPIAPLGDTDLDVFALCLGGNVFGWTIDEERSFEVLDAYVAAAATSSTRPTSTAGAVPEEPASPSGSSAAGWPRAATASSS